MKFDKSNGLLALAAATMLTSSAAAAADLGPYRPGGTRPETTSWAPTQIERWTGFYFGGTIGYGSSTTGVEGTTGTFNFNQTGGLGTLFAGYNWQLGNSVFGLEADIGTGTLGGSAIVGNNTISSELNAMGSLRARAGILTGPALLVYGTAGLAWADMDFKLNGMRASETLLGYQVGAGAEMMIAPQWTLRVEYLYTDLDKQRLSHGGLGAAQNTFDPDFHTVRAGLSFKF